MNADELKQFTELAKKFEAKDLEEVKKVVQSSMHPVFQDINDGGRAAANADNKQKLEKTQQQLDAEKQAREKAETDLKALEGKAPEATKLKEKYDAEVTLIRQQSEQKVKETEKQLLEERLEVAKAKLSKELEDLKVDPEYASTVLVAREDVVARLKPGEKGKVDVLKAGSQDVTIVPAEGKTAVKHLAEELAEKVPDRWKTSKVKRGSGTHGSGGGGGSDGTIYDNIRNDVAEKTKEQKKQNQTRSGLERLGSRR